MKARHLFTLFAMLPVCGAVASDDPQADRVTNMGLYTLQNRVMRQTSAFLTDQVIQPKDAKGILGESLGESYFLKTHKGAVALSPRHGQQGLDHIFISKDAKTGQPVVTIAESKTDKSQLKMTKSGKQMSQTWIDPRLSPMGKRYQSYGMEPVAGTSRKMPLGCKHSVEVQLPNGRRVSFFKASADGELYFTGTRQELEQARKLAVEYGQIMQDAAAGKIQYNKILLRTDTKAGKIEMYRLTDDGKKQLISEIPLQDLKKIQASPELREALAVNIRKACPELTEQAARAEADALLKDRSVDMLIKGKTGSIAWKSGRIGVLALLAQGCITSIRHGDLHWKYFVNKDSLLTSGFLTGGSAVDFYLKRMALRSQYSAVRTGARIVGKIGGITAALFIAKDIYDYKTGKINKTEFVDGMVLSGACWATGVIAPATAMGLVGAFGAASTGTAISTLSGAAATNATLAWFGGGSLATGGLGMSGGVIILSGGTVLVVAAVGTATYFLLRRHRSNQSWENLGELIRETRKPENLREIIRF